MKTKPEPYWELQQKCPKENWVGDPENRWVTVKTFFDLDEAKVFFETIFERTHDWPSRLVEFKPRVIGVQTTLSSK
jgi:hypothetical protein